MSPIISPRELAEAIGVSESSLKRWADDGLIQVSKTAGGHRRIAIGEAIRFIRATRAPLLRPEAIGMDDLARAGSVALLCEDPAEGLFALLREGKEVEACGLIVSLYLSGRSVAEIGDGPIRSAMERIGELWRHEEAGIFVEHRATAICCQAVERLRFLLDPPDASFTAVVGGAAGDPYTLAPLLVTATLVSEGATTTNLGPDTPTEALLASIEEHGPRILCMSVNSIRDANEIERGIVQLAARLSARGAALAVGGRVAGQLQLPARRSVHFTESLVELAALIRSHKRVAS